MLDLKHIRKTYKIGDIETQALDDINVAFREKEFVAILGVSGSGKTTCLNIIGGLDRYDSGEMSIKGKKTKDFEDTDWDAYRNNSIGFVFQNYNLITHLSIVANVELSMTLSGVSSSEKRKRAVDVLERVGLKEHLHKKPNQLSGGQMQRVAIARALVNNPEILLCDEPTGALDTITSIQILDIIKEISKDRLVIMVTHNSKLAEKYADRTIQFQDGNIISDSNPHEVLPKTDEFKLIKTSMSFLTALKLSFNNIRTKKGRTSLTAFASSIGIIGIAVILSLSSGFQTELEKFQTDAMSEFPIIISQTAFNMTEEKMQEMSNPSSEEDDEYVTSNEVFLYEPDKNTFMHQNVFTDEYITYVNNIDPEICSSIGYTRLVNMNLLFSFGDMIMPMSLSMDLEDMGSGSHPDMSSMPSMGGLGLSSYPIQINKEKGNYLEENYDLLSGSYPSSEKDLVLVVDNKNRISIDALKYLGFPGDEIESISFDDIVGMEFKAISNDDFYVETGLGTYLPGSDFKKMYESEDSITLKISGIVRQSPDSNSGILSPGLAYSDQLSQTIIDKALDSDIVNAQKEVSYNIITKQDMSDEEKDLFLSILGGNSTPFAVMLYPTTFDDKDAVTAYLDDYNKDKVQEDKIIYSDLAKTITDMTVGIMNGITLVLVAFAAISLVVSLIMISIITYTSVLERTKEIGILKALGARKKDITRVFDAETFLLGVFSGILGITIALLLIIPINSIIYKFSDLKDVAQLEPNHAILLILVSTALTMLGGHIPARIASKKDAVEALRSE
ncbi:MAG: ATP-binding cassette domain-containing protein [Vulcanibacillus sp.]